jgi:hypothetical protein
LDKMVLGPLSWRQMLIYWPFKKIVFRCKLSREGIFVKALKINRFH